jgi:hypothetical protein
MSAPGVRENDLGAGKTAWTQSEKGLEFADSGQSIFNPCNFLSMAYSVALFSDLP